MRLALDPGKTTGVAWRTAAVDLCPHQGDAVGGPCTRCGGWELQGIQWPGEDIWVILNGWHTTEGITELVVESFLSRPGPAVNLSAPETIGRIKAWADQYGIPVIMQTPSAAKTRVTNDRLRAAGGWLRSQQHARDAVRHLLLREHNAGEFDLEQYPKEITKGI